MAAERPKGLWTSRRGRRSGQPSPPSPAPPAAVRLPPARLRLASLGTACLLGIGLGACSQQAPAPAKPTAAHPSSTVAPSAAATPSEAEQKAAAKASRRQARTDDAAAFFQTSKLHQARLELDAEAEADLRHRKRSFTFGTLTLDGNRLEGVGVRLKGHRSMREIDEKPSFVIDVTERNKGRRVAGMRRLVFNAMVEDPTEVREALAYDLFRRAGMLAPRTTYVALQIGDRPAALYLAVEALNKDFLAANPALHGGGLFEGDYGCDLEADHVRRFDKDGGQERHREALGRLVGRLPGGVTQVFAEDGTHFDRDATLTFLALTTLVGDFDGYRHAHNYTLACDAKGERWCLLPWGLDRILGKHLPPFHGHESAVAKACMADRSCRYDYARTLKAMNALLVAADLPGLAQRLWALIDGAHLQPDAAAQPHSPAKRAAQREALRTFLATQPTAIEADVACVTDAGEADADGDGYGCMDCNDGDPAVHPGAIERCDGVDNDCSGDVDDGPDCPCPTEEAFGATFAFCAFERTWLDAERHCQGLGMHLAHIETREQARAVYAAAGKLDVERFWIGLSDRDHEHAFRWADGRPTPFTYWKDGQPDNNACGEDCVAVSDGHGGRWYDTACNLVRPFACSTSKLPRPRPPAASPARR